MTTVHSTNNNSNNEHVAGATSPGWHFPKSGLGTPDLFYSFSGASSSSNIHHNAASSSNNNTHQQQQQQQQQPAWLRPSGNDTVDSNPNGDGRSTQASSSQSVKKEDDDGADDAVEQQQANRNLSIPAQLSRASNGEATGNEEGMLTFPNTCIKIYLLLILLAFYPICPSSFRLTPSDFRLLFALRKKSLS
jgi:hypothetical protein